MPQLSRTARWFSFIAVSVTTAVFWLQLCDLVYDCGCHGFWAGAADHCNVHTEPAGSPHRCPWCVSPLAGGASFLGTAAWFALTLLPRWPQRLVRGTAGVQLLVRIGTAGFGIPAFVFGVGWISGALMGYWGPG